MMNTLRDTDTLKLKTAGFALPETLTHSMMLRLNVLVRGGDA